MIKEIQLSLASRRERLRYGLGAVCIGIAALLLLLSFRGGAAQGLAAPLAPAVPVMSSETSLVTTYNTIGQAVAGELVTVTAVFNVPTGDVIHNASPRVVLQDGLYPIGASQVYTLYTGTRDQLRVIEGADNIVWYPGALLVFPNQGTITGPDVFTMTVYAMRRQKTYVGTPADITHNTNLRVEGILRYCTGDPGCLPTLVVNTINGAAAGQVTAIRPDIALAAIPTYLDVSGVGAGGGQVRLTFNASNNFSNISTRPTAYDIVFTATLGSGLTYDASSGSDGAGSGTVSMAGGVTYVSWNVPVSVAGGASWQAVITATLPSTFTIGTQFAYGAQVIYETFAGDMADEGVYSRNTSMTSLLPGIAHSKRSNLPTGTDVKIGEILTYTVAFTQGANTNLPSPYYMDDLPVGFEYMADTLDVQGGADVTNVTVTAGTLVSGFRKERLSWFMQSLPVSDSARYITAVYRVHNTGLDYDDKLVWTSATDLAAIKVSPNSAVLNVSSLAAVNASVDVLQPYLGNLTNFKTARTDGDAYAREVGQLVRFKSEFRNTGRAPAYEVKLCDQLPTGIVLNTQIGIVYSSGFPARIVEPVQGDNLLCWELDVVPIGTTYSVEYYAEVLATAIPGVPLANNFYAVDYTSMPGDVLGERHYNQIQIAVPSVTCSTTGCLSVLGLTVNKAPLQTNVGPGALVTYTLSYQDTSTQFDYQNVVLTDTFDSSLISFVDASPLPTQQSDGQLVWNVGDLANTSSTIALTMEVAEVIPDGVYELLNNLSWSSAEIPLHTISRSVALQAANLNLAMYGPAHVHADEDVVYTVVYSNTGSAVTSTVVLTLDYGPYVEFVSATPAPRQDTENVFDDVLPNTGANHTLTINLRVKAPLPYDLSGPLAASVLLESTGAESKQANISMILDRPVLVLEKIGPQVAPGVGVVIPYTIRIHNQGTYTATAAMITDTWGSYLTYDAANQFFGWTLSGDGTYATQSLGEVGIGEIVEKLFQVVVAENAISYMNTVNLTSDQTTEQEEVEHTWQRSIATTKSATPVPAFPGRTLTYTIYYTSTSPDPMLNARITDTLPSDFVYQSYTAPQGGCQFAWGFTPPASGGGGNAVWSCSALIANGSGHFTISGNVNTEAEGTNLENSTVTSADNIPVRPIETPLVTRVARPWLRVDKAGVPAHPVAPGDLITYTLTYENYGTDPAYNVIIKDQLPTTQVTYVSCSGGNTCGQSDGLVTWNLAEVPVGTVGDVKVVVQVKPGTAGQTALNAAYTIQSDRLPVAETISGPAVSSVILDPHLAAEKLVNPSYVTTTGDHITYTIRLTNDGGGILHNVVVTDAIDAKTIVEPSTLSPECASSGSPGNNQVITCDIGTLAQGAVKVVQFEVYLIGVPVQGDSVTNTAYHHSDETAFEPSNETTVWVTTGCIPPHDVDFTVSANPQAGQPVTFSASAAGDTPMTFAWAFGDTQTGNGQVVEHTYAVSGTYKVDLTASNGCIAPVTVSEDVFVPGAPEIVWTPPSFTKFADEGSATPLQDTLTVSNTGTANLVWSVSVMAPTEATWLRIAIGGGDPETVILPQVTLPGYSAPVKVYFNPDGLAAGTYTAQLRITSNDADEDVVLVPVTFTIRPPDEDYYIYLPLVLRNAQ